MGHQDKIPSNGHQGDMPQWCSLWTVGQRLKIQKLYKTKQLERLRSEDTPHRLMITHIIESYWIPSQTKTKSKLQI